MKCKICGKKTTYNESYGRDCFIVCPRCHKELVKQIKSSREIHCSPSVTALNIILEIGYLMEEGKKK